MFPFMYFKPIGDLNVFEVITFLFILFFYKKKESVLRLPIKYKYLFIFLFFILIIGLLLTEQPFISQNILGLIKLFPLFVFAKILTEEIFYAPSFFYEIIYCLKYVLIFSLVFLLIQMVVGIQFSLFVTQNPNIIINNAVRFPSFMSDPQVFSQLLGSLFFLTLISAKPFFSPTTLNYLLVFCCVLGIFIAGGRAGLMGFIFCFLLIFIYSKWVHKISYLALTLSIFLMVYLINPSFAIFMRSTDLNDTYDFRASIWNTAQQIFQEHFLFGLGINNYSQYVSTHYPDQAWLVDNEWIAFDHPESGYLKFLTEWGLLGFLVFVILLSVPFIQSFLLFIKKRDMNLLFIICSLICFLIGFYSTYSLGDVRIGILLATTMSIMVVYPKIGILKNTNIIHSSSYQ
jgi:O-antigen ligase